MTQIYRDDVFWSYQVKSAEWQCVVVEQRGEAADSSGRSGAAFAAVSMNWSSVVQRETFKRQYTHTGRGVTVLGGVDRQPALTSV